MENLLQRRLALGLSKRKVAKLTNLSRRTVLNAENGSWTLGASWDLGVGSHDRLDNAFTLKARYAF